MAKLIDKELFLRVSAARIFAEYHAQQDFPILMDSAMEKGVDRVRRLEAQARREAAKEYATYAKTGNMNPHTKQFFGYKHVMDQIRKDMRKAKAPKPARPTQRKVSRKPGRRR